MGASALEYANKIARAATKASRIHAQGGTKIGLVLSSLSLVPTVCRG